jgi:HlyD family secretion protein
MDQPISAQHLNRRKRARLLLLIGVLSSLAFAAWGLNRMISPSVSLDEVRVVKVRRGDIANTINASGVVIPSHEEQVSSPVQTQVSRVHVKAGQEVAAGELLLELDDHAIRLAIDDLEEQIAQQEIKIQSLTMEMKQKQKQLASEIELLGLDLAAAKVRLGRFQRLEKIGASSAADLNAAELVVKRTEIELRQHRESVADTARATQTDIRGALLQQAILQKQLERQKQLQAQTQVRAPIAGMLTWVMTDTGASVQNGQMVAKVSELHNYRVQASVSDFYARYLSSGQLVRIGYSGQTLLGRVQTVLPEIQNGTISLLVSLDKPDSAILRNKLRVDVNIVTEQKTGTLVADSGPAINGRGRQDVFVVDGSIARKKQLDIGVGDGNAVEIVSGAKVGDRLIVSDVSRYKHLDSIRVSN